MHPVDQRRPLSQPPQPPVPLAGSDPPFDFDAPPTTPVVSAPLRLTATALLVEARFRGITLASRLMRSDQPRTFEIGNARGADAPVNPAWLPELTDPIAPRRHLLVEPAPGSSVAQSSSLGAAADSCVVNAVKRWEFPQPDHGGMAVVSYPFSFSFSPAGG